jgi:hypothetical protein
MKKKRKPSDRNRRSGTRSSKHSSKKSTKRGEEDMLDALAALKLMRREGLTAKHAAKVEGTTVKKMRKYVGPALRRRGADYVAKPSDRLIRHMKILDARGIRFIVVRGSRTASLVGRYWNAIDAALKGKPSALQQFRGRKISYTKLKFLTNLKTLRRLQDAGVLDNVREIYWRGRKR